MLSNVLLEHQAAFVPFARAYAERSLTIMHDIQAKQQTSNCLYSVSILVIDSVSRKAISDSVVEFQISSNEVLTNKTDLDGATEISLIINGEQGRSCMETLLSRGYTIEASKMGYEGYGIGRVS